MGRRKKRRKRPQQKVSMLTALGVAGGVLGAYNSAAGLNAEFFNQLIENYTGYHPVNKTFDPNRMKKGLLPLAIGAAGSMIAAKTGINRRLQFPFIKL